MRCNTKILERVKTRIPEDTVSYDLLEEYIQTVSDRLCLRLGTNELPTVFESICTDAVVKMVRRTYYEGISSEGVANISTSFVENILGEYAQEIEDWKNTQANNGLYNGKVVHFL